jgi:hypothetical protein
MSATSLHLRPHFFIIGERKCGTSSLYRYLLDHPQVLPGIRKEMQFFTRGEAYIRDHFEEYLSSFPLAHSDSPALLQWPELNEQGLLYEEELRFPRELEKSYVTGEASADTFCEVPPALLRRYLPELRLILLLRDPVERAFSHHRMLRRFQDEGRVLPQVIGDFESDMRAEMAAVRRGEKTTLLSPGLYLERIQAWVEEWGRDPLLLLFANDLNDPAEQPLVLRKVLDHLGLPPFESQPALRHRHNQAPTATMPASIRDELVTFYQPHSAALQDYLQRPLPWAQAS